MTTDLAIVMLLLAFIGYVLYILSDVEDQHVKRRESERKMMRCNHIAWRDRMEEKFPDIIGDKFREDTERMKGDLKK